jgi:hypothetical protein
VSPCQVDGRLPEEGDVGLSPGVLVAADYNAGVITPEEKQMLKFGGNEFVTKFEHTFN